MEEGASAEPAARKIRSHGGEGGIVFFQKEGAHSKRKQMGGKILGKGPPGWD